MVLRAYDQLRIGVWIALGLVLALTFAAQQSQILPSSGLHHLVEHHPDPGTPSADDGACLLACMAVFDAMPVPFALTRSLARGEVAFPWAVLLTGQELEWAGRPPWMLAD